LVGGPPAEGYPAGGVRDRDGLAGWTIDRFIARRTRLHQLQYAATRLRERPVIWSMLLVVAANVVVFWLLASAAAAGRISLGEAVVYVQCAVGVSMIAFGGFSWALDGADSGRITILVSHRFSTVRMADLIVVLDGARWWRSAPTKS
jgi:ABC-type multidrug transport system fused ATPase/permease subunit